MVSVAVTGAEALLRWDDPELGPVSPLRFIGVAEETGLIVPLGRWVLTVVLRQLAAWLEQGWSFPVAINLSVRQFTDGLVDDVERALREAGVDVLYDDRVPGFKENGDII